MIDASIIFSQFLKRAMALLSAVDVDYFFFRGEMKE